MAKRRTNEKKTKETKTEQRRETKESVNEKILLSRFLRATRLIKIDSDLKLINESLDEADKGRQRIKALEKDAKSRKSNKQQKDVLQELSETDGEYKKQIANLESRKKRLESEMKLVRQPLMSRPRSS